jgi:hypothetical protein
VASERLEIQKTKRPSKKITLTVEWSGACSEQDWAQRCIEMLTKSVSKEFMDRYGKPTHCAVTEVVCHTNLGTTEIIKNDA